MKAFQESLKSKVGRKRQHLKFACHRDNREDLLRQISELNRRLDEFMKKQDTIATYRAPVTTPISKKEEKDLVQYWRHADKIYALIHQSWGCRCKN
jgi:hypothetical protein